MKKLEQSPSFLLVATGTLLGLNFPIGKLSTLAGISPVVWAFLISFGAVVGILPKLLLQRRLHFPNPRTLRFVVLSGGISFVIPNLLLLTVIGHVGAGFTGLMFALSPVFTTVFALALRMRTPNALGMLGIVLGLVGMVGVTLSRASMADSPGVFWVAMALAIPVVLAVGNVYRTLDWPDGASPDSLAFWSHVFACLLYVSILIGSGRVSSVSALVRVPEIAGVQIILSAMSFPLYFRLQLRGGPVLLSQLGYVAAAVGLLAATVVLGERYAMLTWIGACIVLFGLSLSLLGERTRPKPTLA